MKTIDHFDKHYKEVSVADFFRKNRQMLGYTGPIKSLTMVVHELITNSLDACEEFGVLPDIKIELDQLGERNYRLTVRDNGPGIPVKYLGNLFGKMLSGTKFARFIQTRGQLGLGAAGVVLYSQLTTGKPTLITSAIEDGKGTQVKLMIDTEKNVPKIFSKKNVEEFSRGTEMSLKLDDVMYTERREGAYEYIRRTAIANPHAEIIFRTPEGERIKFERVTNEIPPKPEEVKPHPHGITSESLLRLAKSTNSIMIGTMLKSELSRVTKSKINTLEKLTGMDLDKKPSEMSREDANKLVKTMNKMKFMAPATDCLVSIGEKYIQKSLKKTLDPEYVVAVERSPITYKGGIPFQVEVGIAYGGKAGREASGTTKNEILRFGNRAPLTFDQGACVITEAVESIDWGRYGLNDYTRSPLTFFINVTSTHIPYLSTGKQAIVSNKEILNELRNALMAGGRKIKRFFRKKRRRKKRKRKMNLLKKYLPIIAEDAAELAGVEKPKVEHLIK